MEYIEETFIVNNGPRPGKIIIDSEGDRYNVGVWRVGSGTVGTYVQMSAGMLHEIASFIKNNVPQKSNLDGADFITAEDEYGDLYSFFRDGDVWVSMFGTTHSEDDILANYTDVRVIR